MSITITLDHIPAHISTTGLPTRVNMSDPHDVGQIEHRLRLFRKASDESDIAFSGDSQEFLAFLDRKIATA